MDKLSCLISPLPGGSTPGLPHTLVFPSRNLHVLRKRLPCAGQVHSRPVGVTIQLAGSEGRTESRTSCETSVPLKEETCASPAAEDEGSQGLQKAASCLGILCAIVMFGWVEPAHAHFDYFTGVKTTVRLGDFGLASIGSQKPKQRGDASLSKLFQKTKTVQQKAAEDRAKAEKERIAAREEAAKQKAATEARAKAEKEELMREKQARSKLEQQAFLGGSAVGLSYALMKGNVLTRFLGDFFRTIGGPNLIATLLRTPGYIVGRQVHLVEWNVAESPEYPDGAVRTIRLKTHTLSGLRTAISKQYGLSNSNMVSQMSSWISFGPGFFEPLTDFNSLPDPGWVVWSRKLRKGKDAIPTRANPASAKGKTADHKDIQWQTSTIIKLVQRVAVASRSADHIENGNGNNYSAIKSLDEDLRGFESSTTIGMYHARDPSLAVKKSELGPSTSENRDRRRSTRHASASEPRDEIFYPTYDCDDVLERVLEGTLLDSDAPYSLQTSAGKSLSASLKANQNREGKKSETLDTKNGENLPQGSSEGNGKVILSSTDHHIPDLNKHNDEEPEIIAEIDSSSHESCTPEILSPNPDDADNKNESTSARSPYHHPACINAAEEVSDKGLSGEVSGLFAVDLSRECTLAHIPENFEAISEEEESHLVLLAAEKNSAVLELFRVVALEGNDVWGFFRFLRVYSNRTHQAQ